MLKFKLNDFEYCTNEIQFDELIILLKVPFTVEGLYNRLYYDRLKLNQRMVIYFN